MIFAHKQGERPPLYSTNYPLRIFTSLRAMYVTWISLSENQSLHHKLIVEGESWPSVFVVWLLLFFGVWAFIDAVINDLLPDKFDIRWMAEHRHLTFLAIAAINVGFSYVAVSHGYASGPLIASFILDAGACVFIAIYHIRHRYVVPRATAAALESRTWGLPRSEP